MNLHQCVICWVWTRVCVCVYSCVSTWTGPYQSTDNRTIGFLSWRRGRWRLDAACMPLFMTLYYLTIPQSLKHFTTGDAAGAAQSSRRLVCKSVSRSDSRSCRWVKTLLFSGLFGKCCYRCKQFKYPVSEHLKGHCRKHHSSGVSSHPSCTDQMLTVIQ